MKQQTTKTLVLAIWLTIVSLGLAFGLTIGTPGTSTTVITEDTLWNTPGSAVSGLSDIEMNNPTWQ